MTLYIILFLIFNFISLISHATSSFLLAKNYRSEVNSSVQDMTNLINFIYEQQNPPLESCFTKRLLVFHVNVVSFEGVGSLLKMVRLKSRQFLSFSNVLFR